MTREAAKKWYENIPEQGILCKAWDYKEEKREIIVITQYKEKSSFPFVSLSGEVYKHAEPLFDEEIKKFLRGDKR